MKRGNASILLVALVLLSGAIRIAIADYVETDLNTDGADTGFSGGWSGSANVFPIQTSDLVYNNYVLTQTGTTEYVYGGNTSHPNRQDRRDLAAAMSNEVWFSVLVHVAAGANFAGLSFNNNSANDYAHASSDPRVVMAPNQVQVSLDGGAWNTSGSFSADTTHLILGRMDIVPGADTIEVWVDPNLLSCNGPGGLPLSDYTNTAVDFASAVTNIGVPYSHDVGGTYIDAIRLSDTATAFRDVTGVLGDIRLSSEFVASNAPPGTLVGNLSWTGSSTVDEYKVDQTQGDYAYFDIPIGTTNLRTTTWIDTDSVDVYVIASSNGTEVSTNCFTIEVMPAANPRFVVEADVQSGAADGTIVGTAQADVPSATFSIIGGRNDLFSMNGAQLKVANSASWGGVSTTHYVVLQASSGGTDELVVKAIVVSGAASGTVFRFR